MLSLLTGTCDLSVYTGQDSKELSITVDNPNKVLLAGHSKDLGVCSGTTKAGKKCSNFINTKLVDIVNVHSFSYIWRECSFLFKCSLSPGLYELFDIARVIF